MTEHTADDFARAKFARHPEHGLLAMRDPHRSPMAWINSKGGDLSDWGMAERGWVPVREFPNPEQHNARDLAAYLWKKKARYQIAKIADRDDAHASCEWDRLEAVHRAEKADSELAKADAQIVELNKEAQAYSDALSEEQERAEKAEQDRDKAQRAAQTLGKIIEDQCRDIAKITGSEDMVAEDGDADWGAIWERGHEMAERLATAEKERDEALRLAKDAMGDLDEQLRHRASCGDCAQPRPLTPEDITDEMVERAQREYPLSPRTVRDMLTAALTEPPQRPEGAEGLDGHVDASLRGVGLNPLSAEELRTVADNLASEGVRAPEDGAA